MTAQELKQYIEKVLGNGIRCLLPSYWWKRLFGLVVDKVEEVDTKVANLPTKKYVDDAVTNVDIAVDGVMSDTSTNPVQNKTIKQYVDEAVANVDIAVDSSMSSSSTNPVQNKVVKAYVDNAVANIDVSTLVTKEELEANEEVSAAAFNDLNNRLKVLEDYISNSQ